MRIIDPREQHARPVPRRPSFTVRRERTCGVLLPYLREPCARRPGHGDDGRAGGHRSAYAMDNAARMRRSA